MGICSGRDNKFYYAKQTNLIPQQGYSAIYRNQESIEKLKDVSNSSIKTLQDILIDSVKNFPQQNLYGTKDQNGIYRWKTYKQCFEIAQKLGTIIEKMNFAPQIQEYQDFKLKMVSIYSKNREEWMFVDFACILQGISIVPLYDTLGPETIQFVLAQTNLTTIFVAGECLQNLKKEQQLQKVTQLICFDPINEEDIKFFQQKGIQLYQLQNLLNDNQKVEILPNADVKPNDVFTFSYTSGTTGNPKGALLSHLNIVSVIESIQKHFEIFKSDVHLSYLPLPHVMERLAQYNYIRSGASIGFYGGDIQKIKDDLQALQPTIFISVPRLYNKMYDKIKSTFDELQGFKGSLAKSAVETKMANFQENGDLNSFLYDTLVFKKVKQIFGGRVRLMLTGSAPISRQVIDFLKIAVGCPIIEGYGQTESGGASFLTNILDNQSGHVGGPQTNIEFRLMDVPEMNYTSKDLNEIGNLVPRGEIHIRGQSVFLGYYKEPDLTKDAIDQDGWLRTGDIGQILPNGSLQIIDRKKNIFKLSQGEYVAPEKIEMTYGRCSSVAESFVYGDSLQSHLIAVIVPDQDYMKNFALQNNLEFDIKNLCNNKELEKVIFAQMEEQAKKDKLLSYERAKVIKLIPESFQQLDVVTNTFKLKRFEAKKRFQEIINELYTIKI